MTRTITSHDEWEYYAWTFGDSECETVLGPDVVDTRRWTNAMEKVVKEKSTGKYFLLQWEEGATECQHMDFEDSEHYITEVEPYEEVVISYRPSV